MIKTAIRLQGDMVMVFDAEGEQVPEFQGQYEDVKGSIMMKAPSYATFAHWFENEEPEAVSRESW